MPGCEIHVHITREELIEKVQKWMSTYPISAFAQRFSPFSSTLMKKENIEILNEKSHPYGAVMFTTKDPIYPVRGQFPEEYPDRLILFLPEECLNAVEQISFGIKVYKGQEFNKNALDIWKLMIKDLKKDTKPGLRLYYPISGEYSAPKKFFRYSRLAEKAYLNGAKLLLPNQDAVGAI